MILRITTLIILVMEIDNTISHMILWPWRKFVVLENWKTFLIEKIFGNFIIFSWCQQLFADYYGKEFFSLFLIRNLIWKCTWQTIWNSRNNSYISHKIWVEKRILNPAFPFLIWNSEAQTQISQNLKKIL